MAWSLLIYWFAAGASAQVSVPFPEASLPRAGLEAPMPGGPGLAAAPEAADADPWPELERRLLIGVAAPLEARTEAWKAAVARRLRSDPSLPLSAALGKALGEVHRLAPRQADAAVEVLESQAKDAAWQTQRSGRLFAVDGVLYAAEDGELKRYSGVGWDVFTELPRLGDIREVRKIDGELVVASDRGVFALPAGSREWRRVADCDAHTVLGHGSDLYVGTSAGLMRRSNGAWARVPAFGQSAIRHLAQVGERFFAATGAGLYEGRPAEAEQRLPDSFRSRYLGGAPFVVKPGQLAWAPKPLLARPVERTLTIDGRLAVSGPLGLFAANEDGTWRHEYDQGGVDRVLQLSDGRVWAVAGGKVHQRGARGWTEVVNGWRYDIAAFENVLFIGGHNSLRILLGLKDGWQETLAASLASMPLSAPPAGPENLSQDGGALRGRSGRTIFGP